MTNNSIKKMQRLIQEWKDFADNRCIYKTGFLCMKGKDHEHCNLHTCPGGDDK